MNTYKLTAAIILLVASLTACDKYHLKKVNGTGNNVTEMRTVGAFTGINLSIDADVVYVQDSITSVEVDAQANIAEVLTTKVRSGELVIEYSARVYSHNTITITIHAPSVNKLKISGSGNVTVPGVISSNGLDLEVSGSGKIIVGEANSDELDAKISGSGSISISSGTINSEEVEISGSGDVDLLGVQSQFAEGDISGSGDLKYTVQQHLDARISGSGDIRYAGDAIVDVHVSGSGSVIHI